MKIIGFLVLVSLLVPGTGLAGREPDTSMAPAPDFDIRGPLPKALPQPPAPEPESSAQASTLNSMQTAAGDLTVRWSALTRAPSRVYSVTGALTEPSENAAKDIAINFLTSNLALFNLLPQDVGEIRFSRNVAGKNNGVTHLTIQQQVNGIDVFEGTVQFNIDRHGRVLSVSGEPIPGIHASVNIQTPVLSSDEAAKRADHAGVTALKDTRFVGLVYFPLSLGNTHLAWDVIVEDVRTPNVYQSHAPDVLLTLRAPFVAHQF